MARSRSAEFGPWANRVSKRLGTQIPRSVTFSTLSPENQDIVNARGVFAGEHILDTAERHLESLGNVISGFTETHNPENIKVKKTEHKKLSENISGIREALGGKKVDFSVGGLASNFRSLLDAGFEKARSVTRFRKQQTGSTVLEQPAGGAFYVEHPAAYLELAKRHLGGSTASEKMSNAERLTIAGAEFSAKSAPQDELRAASGLARIESAKSDIGFDISHHAAKYLNTHAKKINSESVDIEPGSHSLGSLPAEHAALVTRAISDRAKGNKIHQSLARGLKLDHELKDFVEPAAMDVVAGAASGGVPSMYRAYRKLKSGGFSDETDYLKVGTYATTNVLGLRDNENLGIAVKHMIGAATHGDEYWDRNPGALEHVLKMQKHPLMQADLGVSDVHAARSMTNPGGVLNLDQISSLDTKIRPEGFLSGQSKLGGKFPSVVHEGRTISPEKLGYLLQEEALVHDPTPVPAKGRTLHLRGGIDQAIGWLQQQMRMPSTAKARKAIETAKNLKLNPDIESDVRSNPEINLNPSSLPNY